MERSISPARARSAKAAVRLTDGFLAREPRRVALGRVGAGVAVGAFCLGEAALAKAVPLERSADALDLDDVDADPHVD